MGEQFAIGRDSMTGRFIFMLDDGVQHVDEGYRVYSGKLEGLHDICRILGRLERKEIYAEGEAEEMTQYAATVARAMYLQGLQQQEKARHKAGQQ